VSESILEPAELDVIYFRSGNDFYLKRVEDAGTDLDTDDDGRMLLYSDAGHHIVSRADGPAIIQKGIGLVRYVYNGLLHRFDGPAFVQLPGNGRQNIELYYAFGLDLLKEDYEKYGAFIKKAHKYIVDNDCSLQGCYDLGTEEKIVKSFETYTDFIEAATRDSLQISFGTQEIRETKWVSLGNIIEDSGLGVGLAAVALLGGAGIVLSGLKKSKFRAIPRVAEIKEVVNVGKQSL